MDFTEIRVNNVLFIHHSTSSTIQMIIEGDNPQVVWLDYYDFQNIQEAFKKINE